MLQPTLLSAASSLSQSGGQYLEHAYFSALTGDESFRQVGDHIRVRIWNEARDTVDGLYDNHPDTSDNFRFNYRVVSLDKGGRDFYYNLLRSYLQSGGRLVEALQMYNEAVSSVLQNTEVITSTGNGTGLIWVRDAFLEKDNTSIEYGDKMFYSSCYLGAMFALGAGTFKDGEDRCSPLFRRQRQLAAELTRTCRLATLKSITKMAPSEWKVLPATSAGERKLDYTSHKHNYLR